MSAAEACREVAAAMNNDDLADAITALGPDSPLLPAVRDEIRNRLQAAADAATTPARKEPA
ncbi:MULTISPECIES: hypothetical protein [Dietzia]|uniref:Uncharacterized protein n=1 Tax=Dietzia maris TaxID=37915 RepID=A0AAE4QXW9_9ACTN|nr:hypothetical protein [Dietzia maris]MDV6300215.1 hypothetical protein [Dietzia maris]